MFATKSQHSLFIPMDSPLSSASFSVESDVILSTENETPIPTPAPAIAIPVPPATADDVVRQTLERDSLSPKTAYAALEAHGSELSSKVALLFAKKIAEAAMDKADRSAQRIKFLLTVGGSRHHVRLCT
jgi:hypothetical protein